MERKDREGSSGRAKQEPLSSLCSYSSFAKDKENSEPMDIGSPPSAERAETLSEEASIEPPATASQYLPPPLLSSGKPIGGASAPSGASGSAELKYNTPPMQKVGSSRSSMVHLSTGTTPDAGHSTPQSLSQIINNLPSSNFSFDLGELQSPVGSGFISPGSTKLGKKRPLSISPLSSSSINIDALVRGSPTSLLNFISTQSRNSSAGSFGHLSPSLYATPSNNHNSFNRPTISLSKAVHPSLFPTSTSHTAAALPSGFANTAGGKNMTLTTCDNNPSNGDGKVTMRSELADIADHDASIQPIMKASLEQESEGELSLPPAEPSQQSSTYSESASENESKPFQKHNRRIYYAYPAVEEPHNNCCMWEGCQQQCDSLDHLVMHVNSDHIYQESRKEFVCCWAGCVRERRPFKAQYMLLVHMRRHTGEKPHRCHYQGCEKAYSRLENLKTHLRSHTGEKPYLCKYEGCGKAFSNASDCAKHMNRTHSDEKPYGCLNAGCMKRYTDPSSRRKHMKNCQVNKKARTGCDSTSGAEGEESSMDTRPPPLPPSVESITTTGGGQNKKTSRPRRSEKKRKEESANKAQQQHHQLIDQFPSSQNNMDLGYMSGESQCTPSSLLAALTKGRTQLSGYNSSGYDTEYPSLPEDHNIPPLIMTQGNDTDTFYDTCIVKREQFSPSSQMEHYPYQLSQPPPPPPYTNYKHGLHPLPEVYPSHHQGYQYSYHPAAPPLEASHSSDYSSFGGSPMINSDDTSSMMSSFNGSGQRSLKGSDLSNGSHSSFSTLSSRLSSPISGGGRSVRDYSKHSYRNLRPPDLILRPQQPSYSVQMSDIKGGPPCYRRQSDEVSIRSSHSSRYSGSEYSDDLTRALVGPPPPLPHPDTHSSSRGEPLPLPQSMQPDFMTQVDMVTMTTDPQYMSKDMSPASSGPSSTTSGYHMYTSTNGGMVPLKHYEPLHKQPPLPMIFESQVQSDSPNMVIGSMSINASQLHQDNLLLESLSSSHPYM